MRRSILLVGVFLAVVASTARRLFQVVLFPATFPQFQATFPDESSCRSYLVGFRWPTGFACPRCGAASAWDRSEARSICRSCRHEASLTAGTILHHSRLPLLTWFWAA